MLTLIACPTCHHKFSVPEGCMGRRSTCPNCQSIFVAGKSVAEGNGRIDSLPRRGMLELAGDEGRSPRPPLDKTLLASSAPPIVYNCPRCKKPLESPASEAGTKKPCPSCGGRLQIPALPSAPALDPNLNKTLLAHDESSVQQPTAPVSAAVQSALAPGAQEPTNPSAPFSSPAAQQAWVTATSTPQAPAKTDPTPGRAQKYVIGGLIAACVVFAVLYFIGNHNANLEYEKMLQAQKQELDKLQADISLKTALFQQQQQLEAQQRRQWEEQQAKQEARQRELERERAALKDQDQASEAKARLDRQHRELEDEKRRAEESRARAQRDTQEKLDSLQRQLNDANQRSTTVIQPPPVYPWHRYYYHPFGW